MAALRDWEHFGGGRGGRRRQQRQRRRPREDANDQAANGVGAEIKTFIAVRREREREKSRVWREAPGVKRVCSFDVL